MVNASRWKAYLVLALVFVLGAASGGATSFAYVQRRHATLLGDDARGIENRRLRALSRKLDLNEGQHERIRAILTKDRDTSRDLGRDMFDKCGQPLRDHMSRTDADVRAVLRPDQQKRYDQLLEERHAHMLVSQRCWSDTPPAKQ